MIYHNGMDCPVVFVIIGIPFNIIIIYPPTPPLVIHLSIHFIAHCHPPNFNGISFLLLVIIIIPLCLSSTISQLASNPVADNNKNRLIFLLFNNNLFEQRSDLNILSIINVKTK